MGQPVSTQCPPGFLPPISQHPHSPSSADQPAGVISVPEPDGPASTFSPVSAAAASAAPAPAAPALSAAASRAPTATTPPYSAAAAVGRATWAAAPKTGSLSFAKEDQAPVAAARQGISHADRILDQAEKVEGYLEARWSRRQGGCDRVPPGWGGDGR